MTGVGWMRHLLPFHRSARVRGPEPVRLSPNAVQAEDVGHATLLRKMFWPPGGLGVVCTRHLVPFHRSARVVTGPELPTAVQADDEVQATPLSAAPCPAGLTVGTIFHLLPFQRSASVPTALNELSRRAPTAMQADDEVQATPVRMVNAEPDGLGVGSMRHLVPFHRSASVRPFVETPTAVQPEGDVHDTPVRKPPPGGLGVVWIRHLVPFQRSARMLPLAELPTAVQAERDVHDTPFRKPPRPGLGVAWMCHLVPFHCSASVTGAWDLLVVNPTARHAEREVHDTQLRKLDAAPGGLGAAWVLHVVPFDRSTTTAGDPFGLAYPTAMQAVAEVHVRPIRRSAPAGLVVAWLLHVEPSQTSARVRKAPELLM